MNDVELEVSKGTFRFRGRGPKEWVDEQFEKIFASALPRGGDPNEENFVAEPEHAEATPPSSDSRAGQWMQRNEISEDQLSYTFHRNGEQCELIAATLPGSTAKERCKNAYILAGLRNLLQGGHGQFSDEEARAICIQYGDYNKDNHSKAVNALKPDVMGSKAAGWQLTTPGLAKAATLIRELANTSVGS